MTLQSKIRVVKYLDEKIVCQTEPEDDDANQVNELINKIKRDGWEEMRALITTTPL